MAEFELPNDPREILECFEQIVDLKANLHELVKPWVESLYPTYENGSPWLGWSVIRINDNFSAEIQLIEYNDRGPDKTVTRTINLLESPIERDPDYIKYLELKKRFGKYD